MDMMNKGKKNDFWKYLLGIGAGLGVGYLAYKSFFRKSKYDHSIDSLSIEEAEERSSLIKDLKYNLFLKMRYIHEELHQSLNQHRSAVKGIVEIEFTLSQWRDLSMEFGGNILEIKDVIGKKPVNYHFDREAKKIIIDKTSLKKGQNKFFVHFSVDKCDKGIVYNDKVIFLI